MTATTSLSSPKSPPPSLATPQANIGGLSLRSKPPTPAPLDDRITIVDVAHLLPILNTPQVLILDIRPHATYTRSRIPHALSLSVPSTLLKRPAFSLDKLAEMLPSNASRRRFSRWKDASRIIVYDADSHTMPEGSNVRGLLRKFDREGFTGDLAWLKGGFAEVWREQRTLVDERPPSPDSGEEDETTGYLCAKKLPSSAFQQASTTTASQRQASTKGFHQALVAPPPTSTRPLAANPFYDNIRQNRELEHGITERIPLRLPPSVIARRNELPFEWLKAIVDKADKEEGTEDLAMQFYMIELREQRRLMGVMDHHSREPGLSQTLALSNVMFPYSITAGVEKGSKNRYTNIWPFEHARVRLNSSNVDDGSDYINASHVQPLGTRRRYIATQGPLPTTYTDFWTLCWEQNIHIIVMLTKQIEGATEKCGCYWRQSVYGPLRLEPLSSTMEEVAVPSGLDFDFAVPSASQDAEPPIVRRTFLLSHTEYPNLPPRKVTQFQYLGWPDFDVPEDPRGLLSLMQQVKTLRDETELEDSNPLLLHCSAGIGRTGGFIVVDAALDGIRREMLKSSKATLPHPDTMDVEEVTTDDIEIDASTARESSTYLKHTVEISRRRQRAARNLSQPDSSGAESSPGVTTDGSRQRSLSPGSSVPGTASGSSSRSSSHLLFRATLACGSGGASNSTSTTNLPSVFGSTLRSRDRSTGATSSFPVSVESSRSTSPAKDAEFSQANSSFDYTNPRQLHGNASPELLSSYSQPVRSILEDMREQRMSLCQSLRQYVFVHRAIVEGALDLVDETRNELDARTLENLNKCKRGPSPTELPMEDTKGGTKLVKRPSFIRKERSDALNVSESVAAV
ncbi:protein-tyrosine phosphatase-like protein [Hysterangium stoloniferum]|nr:protein-tyrosine phosphatase-like protein [Hysterangium stoloniferum]